MFNIVNHQFLHISYINDTTFSVSNKKFVKSYSRFSHISYFLLFKLSLASALILNPLKRPRFSSFFRGCKMGSSTRNGLNAIFRK